MKKFFHQEYESLCFIKIMSKFHPEVCTFSAIKTTKVFDRFKHWVFLGQKIKPEYLFNWKADSLNIFKCIWFWNLRYSTSIQRNNHRRIMELFTACTSQETLPTQINLLLQYRYMYPKQDVQHILRYHRCLWTGHSIPLFTPYPLFSFLFFFSFPWVRNK